MTETPPLDQRQVHERRERALSRMRIAGIAAFASASLAVVMFTSIAVYTGDWRAVAPYLLGAALTFGFGSGVYFGHSQVAAGVLLGLAVITAVLRVVQTGQFGGILIAGILMYCYAQGLNGAIDFAEMRNAELQATLPPVI
jgi:hypothetical protein